METIFSMVAGWKGYAAVAVLCLITGAAGTYKVMHNANLAAQVGQANAAVRLVEHQAQINVSIGDIVVKGIQIIQSNTDRIQQEIPQHVTPEMDHTYPVPLGFVRVFNDASHGPIPSASAGGDADPSGVPLSDVAHAHTADEGTLDVCRIYLKGWWDWYDQQKAVAERGK
jgi:hypothetical protein